MDRRPHEVDRCASDLDPFLSLAGDRRTAAVLTETLRGIRGRESLVCSRIAAFSPWARRQPVR